MRTAAALPLLLAACAGEAPSAPADASPDLAPLDALDAAPDGPRGADAGPDAAPDLEPDARPDAGTDVACPPRFALVGRACVCEPPFLLCAGACVDHFADRANCGACGVECNGSLACEGGRCVVPTTTGDAGCEPPALAFCRGACVDLDTDPMNCGACNRACLRPESQHLAATCEARRCVYHCAPGYVDCNANSADGCETAAAARDGGACRTL